MRQLLTAALACCLLSACASGRQPTAAMPVVQPQIAVPPPSSLLAAPQPLPQPTIGQMPTLERNHLETARMYHQLAAQHCGLLQWLQAAPAGCSPWLTPTFSGAINDH